VPGGHGGRYGIIGKKNPDIMRPKIIIIITSVFPMREGKLRISKYLTCKYTDAEVSPNNILSFSNSNPQQRIHANIKSTRKT
jgi:hypothetical protein